MVAAIINSIIERIRIFTESFKYLLNLLYDLNLIFKIRLKIPMCNKIPPTEDNIKAGISNIPCGIIKRTKL